VNKAYHTGRLKANSDDRRLPLDGTFNFRDLGGYETVDGRRVKWGQVYRSDNLSRLTGQALLIIKKLGIRRVCDFRSEGEAKERPDRLPEDADISYSHLPVVHGKLDGIAAFKKIKQGDTSWLTDDFMLQGYLGGIDNCAETWGTFITQLADADSRPLVFHCSAGKDRAGIAAALILLALGIPEKTVIADHQLSNIYIADALDDIYRVIRSYGVDPKRLAPYFAAPLQCILAMLDRLRDAYGSPTRYLTQQAGVTQETLERLKTELLE